MGFWIQDGSEDRASKDAYYTTHELWPPIALHLNFITCIALSSMLCDIHEGHNIYYIVINLSTMSLSFIILMSQYLLLLLLTIFFRDQQE